MTGLATAAIAGAFGLGDGVNESQLVAAVGKASPEHLLALKQAEQNFIIRLHELDVDIERVNAADRASARLRESTSGDLWTPRLLAALSVILFAGCVVFVFWLALAGVGTTDPLVMGEVIMSDFIKIFIFPLLVPVLVGIGSSAITSAVLIGRLEERIVSMEMRARSRRKVGVFAHPHRR